MSISPTQFAYVAELSRTEIGMLYPPGKEYLVTARLRPLSREAGCATVDEYVDLVRKSPAEKRRVLDALTINETSWFRDDAPFELLRDTIIPTLVDARLAQRQLTVWSSACSSGQEAYSIGMLLDQAAPGDWEITIVATDVSTQMLDRVREARYSDVEVSRGLASELLDHYFIRDGSDWVVNDHLRGMVDVHYLNLTDPFPPLPTFDLILLRNVLIYFDAATKADILDQIGFVCAPDGYLLLGSAETILDLDTSWVRHNLGGSHAYRPLDAGQPSASPDAYRITA